MPLFGDQFSNSCRIQELDLGAQMNPYDFEDEQLIQMVDKLLYDEELLKKLKAASNRILNSNKHEELALKIEELVGK